MDVTQDTVSSDKLVTGYSAHSANGVQISGNIATKSAADLTANGSTVTVPAGFYASQATKNVSAATQATPAISLTSSTGVITAISTQTAGYVTAGSKSSSLSLSTQAAATITPSESEQTAVASYKWTTGTVKVAAISSDYVGSNIARISEADIVVAGPTVTSPTGYYSTSILKTVALASLTDPYITLTKSEGIVVVNHDQPLGYVTENRSTTSSIQLSTQATTTIIPSETTQTAVASYKWTTGPVTVAAISSDYVGSNIAQRSSADLTRSGATIAAPAGYYASAASSAIPSSTMGSIDLSVSSSGLIDASISWTEGYIEIGVTNVVQQLSTQSEKTVTPTTSSQIAVDSKKYTTGVVRVAAIPSQYVDISATTATASDIRYGYTAGTSSGIVTGTASMVYNSSTEELTLPGWVVTLT